MKKGKRYQEAAKMFFLNIYITNRFLMWMNYLLNLWNIRKWLNHMYVTYPCICGTH